MCMCFIAPSSSRESKLNITGTFMQEGMKGPAALLHVLGVEPRSEDSKNDRIPQHHSCRNTACSLHCCVREHET
jgi:hypothetical protein